MAGISTAYCGTALACRRVDEDAMKFRHTLVLMDVEVELGG